MDVQLDAIQNDLLGLDTFLQQQTDMLRAARGVRTLIDQWAEIEAAILSAHQRQAEAEAQAEQVLADAAAQQAAYEGQVAALHTELVTLRQTMAQEKDTHERYLNTLREELRVTQEQLDSARKRLAGLERVAQAQVS